MAFANCAIHRLITSASVSVVIERKVIEGRWWLKGQESEAMPGTLEFDPAKGLNLVIKQFRSRTIDELFKELKRPAFHAPLVIFGRDVSNQPVTLHRCVIRASNDAEGIESREFVAQQAFLGGHFNNPETELFGSVQLDLEYLFSWLGQHEPADVSHSEDYRVITIRRTIAEPFELDLESEGVLKLRTHGGTGGSNDRNCRSETTRWTSDILWHFRGHASLHTIDARVSALERLLTFLIGQPAFLRSLLLFRNRFGEPQRTDGKIDRGIEILRARRDVNRNLPDVLTNEFTVRFGEVRSEFARCLVSWLAYHARFARVLDLYFADRFGYNHPIEVRFIFLAQALEVYHRLTTRSNDKALRLRLEELVTKHEKLLHKIIPDAAAFAIRVSNTRNLFTHWGQPRQPVISDDALPADTERLRRLLQTCIFTDLRLSGGWAARLAAEPMPQPVVFVP